MGKGEVSHYEEILPIHSVFKRLLQQTSKNQGLFVKGLTWPVHLSFIYLLLTNALNLDRSNIFYSNIRIEIAYVVMIDLD